MKKMLTDLHIHSKFSDGKLTIAEIVDFYGIRGFDIIAITDHLCEKQTFLGKASRYLNKTLTEQNFQEYILTIKQEAIRAKNQYNMLVIPGVELTKNSFLFDQSAHILALGTESFISADTSIENIVRQIKDQRGLAIAAHPVSTRLIEHQTYQLWDARSEFADLFDAWEVASGAHFFDEVEKSGLPLIASSDFHHPKQINSWKSLICCEKEFESLSSAIKRQDLVFTYYEVPTLMKNLSTSSISHITTLVHLKEGRDRQLDV